MNRELSMEFVRVTEAAAIACGRSVGRGDKNGADQLAVDAMRKAFDTVNISGTVVIGEGEMDGSSWEQALDAAGFRDVCRESVTLRLELGVPVVGELMFARRP